MTPAERLQRLEVQADEVLNETFSAEEQLNIRQRSMDKVTGAQLLVIEVPYGMEYRILNLDGSSYYAVVEPE
ncbi:hypothetical protein SEA_BRUTONGASTER_164 [Gordonia phage BrutonGaster]|uniref:Uncharacterized protein n=1 Tax=Gordonia phage BrutonGaster TaxID=2530116 RepID=A0A482JHF2_9CAUD|nr:hypothetical protein HOV26_gp018 [Gordonia phage BrutonGaster]QBP33378.1 hypothetical protein SEA_BRUTONGASTER_164 [Gordonia phage BrutonGaster]